MSEKSIEFRANLTGRIIRFHVQPGEAFAAGDVLATMECMKMEIPLESEHAGELVSWSVALESQVAQGDVIGRYRLS